MTTYDDARTERVPDQRAAEPQPDAFEAFVHGTADRLLRSALLLTGGDRPQAEDLLQTAYTTAYARWRLVSRADNPLAYTRTILTRTFLDEQRRRRVGTVPLEAAADVASPVGDPATRLSLVDAIAALPPLDRAVVVLRYYEDLTVAETADLLGLSAAACRTRASRALARLRESHPDLDPSTDTEQDQP